MKRSRFKDRMNRTYQAIRKGSRVVLRPAFGGGKPTIAVIIRKSRNIKNGYPGVDYYPEGNPRDLSWAYLDQIDRVL